MPKLRPIYCLEFKKTFRSLAEAARFIGMGGGCISTAATKTSQGIYATAGGCQWAYVDDRPKRWPKESAQRESAESLGRRSCAVIRSDGVKYPSMSAAARANKVSVSRIHAAAWAALGGKTLIVGGFSWAMLESQGIDKQGIDKQGIDKQGIDKQGIDKQGRRTVRGVKYNIARRTARRNQLGRS